jgi:hypothetical protein
MIKDIVGDKVAARLKKANITKINQIKKINPGKLMSLAGIGPATAQRLYRKAGVNYSLFRLNRLYIQIKAKTNLKNIKRLSSDVINNPYKYTNKIDRIKEEVSALDNFAKTVYNFGRPQGEKLPLTSFQPVRTSISIDDQFTSQSDTDIGMLEIFIDIKKDIQVISRYLGFDTAKILDKRTRTFPLNFNIQYLNNIIEHIRSIVNSYLKEKSDSLVVIVLAPEVGIIIKQIETIFSTEIDLGAIVIAKDIEEYKIRYSILKFINNPLVIKLVDKIEERIVRIDGDIDFSSIDWMIQNKESNASIFEDSGYKLVVGSLVSFINKDDKKVRINIPKITIPNNKEKIDEFINGKNIKLSNNWEIPPKIFYLINDLPNTFEIFIINNKHILFEASRPKGFGILILRGGLYE